MPISTSMEYKAGLSAEEASARSGSRKITKLSSNENPFGPSPLAIAAAKSKLTLANIYPDRDDRVICEALANFHGRGLVQHNFCAANGGVEVLSLIEDALAEKGDRAIVCPPCFGAYISSLQKKDIAVDQVALSQDDYAIDVECILAAVTPQTRLVYLCNPNNPTGTWFGEEVLTGILDALPEHVTLIYDEVYYQFATECGLPDALRHVLDGRNIVMVHSFSKAYGLAGLRVGYAIAPPQIANKIRKRKRSFHINSVSMAAAMAALDDHGHIEKTVDNNHSERARLTDELNALGLAATASQANFVLFSCPPGQDATHLTESLVDKGIMVRPAFNLPQHIRVTVGRPEENTRLLTALHSIVGR